MPGNGRSGKPSQGELRDALLRALRDHGELDVNDLGVVALGIRPAVPETPAGNVGDIIEALNGLEAAGEIVKTSEGPGPHRYRAA